MRCQQLAGRIETMQPTAAPRDVARLCLLLANRVGSLDELESDESLCRAWRDMAIRLQGATDQHEAMTEELEELTKTSAEDFRPEQVSILIRAIKVQSQILQMYVGPSRVNAEP
ncbi:MAG: hypothetical protein MPJ50_01520 [Pirellulales bacterium]|nr:hypothetical protein [Pirellulales bacterium]